MINIQEIKSKKNDILKAALSDYEYLRENDRKAEAEKMIPGQKMGYANYSGFYSIENRDKAAEVLGSHKVKIRELLNQVENEINTLAAEPPTTEQTNLLTVLSIGNPTKEELQKVLDANGNNYAMYNAINRLAKENGIYLDGVNPLQDLSNLKDNLKSTENVLFIGDADKKLTPGYVAFIDALG